MRVRSAAAAITLATSLGAYAAPAGSQELRTFKAWNYEFYVPGQQFEARAPSAAPTQIPQDTGSIDARRGPLSNRVGTARYRGDAR